MVWIHVARAERRPAVLQLAARLLAQRPGSHVLFTAPESVPEPRRLEGAFTWLTLPPKRRDIADRFISHFAPNLGLWTSGDIVPGLIDSAARRGIPMVLADAVEDGFARGGLQSLRTPTRAVLRLFSRCLTSDQKAADRLARLGVPADKIEVAGPLQEGSAALPFIESDLEEITEAIGPRPVWLAAMVQPEEIVTILRAHRNATRFAQRLLLIIVPDRPDMAPDMIALCKEENLRMAHWSEGDFPDDHTEIIMADTTGEMGLWYRVASVSFMGSSIIAGKGGCDPFEPAALGSAVLYGPNCGRHLHAYTRLAAAGAARMVRDADSLTAALKHLTGPDRAAAMALAAWEVTSEGAQVADRLTDLIQDLLDENERG